MTTEKTIAFTRCTFVGKVMSLLFNILSRLLIVFLPRSKRLLISWLQSPSAVILEPKKIKSVSVSIVSPSSCHEVMGLDATFLVYRYVISKIVWFQSQQNLKFFHFPSFCCLKYFFKVFIHFHTASASLWIITAGRLHKTMYVKNYFLKKNYFLLLLEKRVTLITITF